MHPTLVVVLLHAPTFELVAICAWFVSIPNIKFPMMTSSARRGRISGNGKPLFIYKNFWHFQIKFLKLLSFQQPPWRNMIHINIWDVCRVWKLLFNISNGKNICSHHFFDINNLFNWFLCNKFSYGLTSCLSTSKSINI